MSLNGERDKILSMLEEGTISASEADSLLNAVGDEAASATPDASTESYEPPDFSSYRANWRKPFNVSLAVLSVSGFALIRAGRRGSWTRFFLWPVAIAALLATYISYRSRTAPWLHMRIQEKGGSRININLPIPLSLLRRGVELGRTYASDDRTREQLEMAAEFLDAMDPANMPDPLVIDVADDDDTVQIFLG